MKKRMLADVLWTAANVWLSETQDGLSEMVRNRYLTCNAIAQTIRPGDYHMHLSDEVKEFLLSLGCPVNSPDGFSAFPQGPVRQGVRYMWLLLAMHVAEDEGIEL